MVTQKSREDLPKVSLATARHAQKVVSITANLLGRFVLHWLHFSYSWPTFIVVLADDDGPVHILRCSVMRAIRANTLVPCRFPMRAFSCFLQQQGNQERSNDYQYPKQRRLKEVELRINGPGTYGLSEFAGEQRTDQRRNAESDEINRTCRAAFDVVGIGFLDDGVRNHRRTRSYTESE